MRDGSGVRRTVALSEDSALIPSIHGAAQSHLQVQFQEACCPLLAFRGFVYMCYSDTYAGNGPHTEKETRIFFTDLGDEMGLRKEQYFADSD